MQYFVVDVREPEEFNLGHTQGAVNIPSQSLMSGVPELLNVPKDTPIIVYCKSGSRSEIAINIFKNLGFTNLTNGINKEMIKQNFGL